MKRLTVALLVMAAGAGASTASATTALRAGEPLPTTAWVAKATLDGESVAPGPGDPDGSGEFGMNPRKRLGRVCYGLTVDGLDAITGAFIHKGKQGEEGTRRLTLFEDAVGRPGMGYYEQCTSGVRRRLIKRIFKTRSDRPWYIEIATAAYPDGAVRGQLGPGDYALALPDRAGR